MESKRSARDRFNEATIDACDRGGCDARNRQTSRQFRAMTDGCADAMIETRVSSGAVRVSGRVNVFR